MTSAEPHSAEPARDSRIGPGRTSGPVRARDLLTKDIVTNSREFLAETNALPIAESAETAANTAQDHTPATTSSSKPLRRVRIAAAAALVPVLVGGGAVASAAHKTVELDVDGNVTTVSTWAGSVEGLLKAEGIQLSEHDELAPGLTTPLSEDSVVVVRIAQPVEVVIDGQPQTIWTTLDSAAEVLADLQAAGRAGSVVASSRSLAARDALSLPLAVASDVIIQVDGTEQSQHFADAVTLSQALEAFGVTLSATDEVTVTVGEGGAVVVKVTRIVHSERTEVQAIPFETVTRTNDSLYKDQTKVVQAGQAGERSVVLAVVTVDGVETQVTEISSTVVAEPVAKIVETGTKARPTAASLGSAPAGVWSALAQCESGGNPAAVSANGLYYGLYQFSISTWASVGGSGLPSQATAAEQTMRAQILQARAGWGQWPYCAAKLGLL